MVVILGGGGKESLHSQNNKEWSQEKEGTRGSERTESFVS